MSKSPDAFRTISEVSEWLDTPTYVLRFWESRFPQIKPVKRAGGRRYYRPEDMMLLGGIKKLLHFDELTIKAVKKMLKEKGVKHVMDLSPDLNTPVVSPPSKADEADKADIVALMEATPTEAAMEEAAAPAPIEKPNVEVRVVKKGKIAKAEELAPHEGADASDATPDGVDQEVVSEETTAETEVRPKSVEEALALKKQRKKARKAKAALTAETTSPVTDPGQESKPDLEPEAETVLALGTEDKGDVVPTAEPDLLDLASASLDDSDGVRVAEDADPAADKDQDENAEPDLMDAVGLAMGGADGFGVAEDSEITNPEDTSADMDGMAKAKAEEIARIEAAKKAAAEKARMDEEAEGWDEMSADMIQNVPFALRPASAYDAKTLAEIETLYYSLRMARNSMRRAKADQENRAS